MTGYDDSTTIQVGGANFFFRRWRYVARLLIVLGLLTFGLGDPAWAAPPRYASMVIDAESGRVLHAANPDAQVYPASLTKIMTLYMLFDQLERGSLKLTSQLPVSAHAANQAPSRLGLKPGETIAVENAVLALVTKSANDVAVVVAEAIGGTEANFAEMMTDRARQLGMSRTQFRNASGLPNPAQLSSARDMATLARALIRDHGRYYHYFSTREFAYNGLNVTTHNRLMLSYEGADGIKTGYIGASGFNLVASAKRDGRRLIGVVFGGKTARARDQHMAELLDKGFGGEERIMTAEVPSPFTAEDEARVRAVMAKMAQTKAARGAAPQVVTLAAPKAPEPKAPEAKAEAKAPPPKPAAVAKVEPKPAKPARIDGGDADWGIQVGAFAKYEPAKNRAAEVRNSLPGLLKQGRVAVASLKVRKGTVYRARVIGLREEVARSACKTLASKGGDCLVLASAAGVTLASSER